MKKYLTFLLLIATISVQAQTVQITSKALGDLIWINRNALEIVPFATGADSTIIRSIDYRFTAQRDTLQQFNIEVRMYDKNASYIASYNMVAPGSIFLKWAGIVNKLDNYTLKKRLIKQN
jgi:hypothetical protein